MTILTVTDTLNNYSKENTSLKSLSTKNKTSVKKVVLHPIFLSCSSLTEDMFWKEIFENLAYGKCPKYFYISNSTICASNKKKNFTYTIPTPTDDINSIQKIYNELKDLLTKNTSLLSSDDIQSRDQKPKKTELVYHSWSDIRKKNVKDILISDFVIRMKKRYKLDWDNARKLLHTIELAFLLKTHTSKDVIFKNKRIEEIRGIEYEPENNEFVNTYADVDVPYEQEEQEDSRNYLYYYWDKYLTVLNKTI